MSEAQRWYAGLPVTGSRVLAADERKHVAWVAADLTKSIGRSFILVIAAFAFLAVFAIVRTDNVAVGWIPLIYLTARRRDLRNARLLGWLLELRRDARAGTVLVCEGLRSQVLGSIGGETAATDRPVKIEVLPRSALLWTRDGRREGDPIAVTKSTTSITPEHARMAANFVKPVEGHDDLLMHQRTLHDDEVAEVLRSVPAFPTVRLLGTLVFVLGVVLCVSGAWIEESAGWGVAAIGAVWCAYSTAKPLPQRIRFRIAMRRDVRVRTAIIIRRREEEGLGSATEFLAASGVVWSTGGQPAPWRRLRG